MKHQAILGLGSSLGERNRYLRLAIILLNSHPKIRVWKRSFIWGSLPLGEAAKNIFFNMVVEIETDLSPLELLKFVIQTEEKLGRKRTVRWSDRTIDIDILLYDEQIIHEPHLSIPHPEMLSRGFVMQPLLEIGSHWIHPIEGCSFEQLRFPPFLGLWKIGFLSLPRTR